MRRFTLVKMYSFFLIYNQHIYSFTIFGRLHKISYPSKYLIISFIISPIKIYYSLL